MKLEMHLHTSETSPCATVPAAQAVAAYARAGYDAIVITDHFTQSVLRCYSGTPRMKVTRYLAGYKAACQAAEQYHMKILFGAEVTLDDNELNDFLIYGANPDFLYKYPTLYKKSQKELFQICDDHDLLLFQAHPFRSYCTPQNPLWLHGAEVYNGNPYYEREANTRAADWASRHHLLRSSGSDFHSMDGIARGGIITGRPIMNGKDLVAALRTGVQLIR